MKYAFLVSPIPSYWDRAFHRHLELFELIGRDAMLKLFKHYRGDKVDLPMRLYRSEFIADIAKNVTDRRERAKIARAGGYTAKAIETMLSRRKKENETE